VWNPVKADDTEILSGNNREVDAALLSVAHTFMVQNYDRGGYRNNLKLFGSIAQKFRGPVGTSIGGSPATGYTKSYAYDPLLVTVSPPKFLAPSATSFTLVRYASVDLAFDSSGVQL
jgi:hypothetical protein